jgi:RND family efflux transporter MFP subunit
MPLYTIVDLSEVWVEIEVREADAPGLRRGADAVVELTALPGQPFRGRVSFVYPELDRATRSVRARVSVANPAMRLKPGMYATVRLSSPARRALTIPASALIRTGERNVVFVDMGAMGGGLMPLEVEVGRATSDYVEILSGVEPGQRVVTSAQFLLESESNIAQVMKAMIGQMSSGDMGQMKDMPGIKMP